MVSSESSAERPARTEDVRLMQLAAQGDPRARNMVAMRLCARVRRVARGLLADPAAADDATQDSLIEILRAAGSYRGEASLERWADRIAVRTGLRSKRGPRRTFVPPQDLTADATDSALSDRLPRPLTDYLGELPIEERRTLFLKHALGYTVPEIASATETAQSTVKFRLSNALSRVRKSIRRDTNIGARTKAGAS